MVRSQKPFLRNYSNLFFKSIRINHRKRIRSRRREQPSRIIIINWRTWVMYSKTKAPHLTYRICLLTRLWSTMHCTNRLNSSKQARFRLRIRVNQWNKWSRNRHNNKLSKTRTSRLNKIWLICSRCISRLWTTSISSHSNKFSSARAPNKWIKGCKISNNGSCNRIRIRINNW